MPIPLLAIEKPLQGFSPFVDMSIRRGSAAHSLVLGVVSLALVVIAPVSVLGARHDRQGSNVCLEHVQLVSHDIRDTQASGDHRIEE